MPLTSVTTLDIPGASQILVFNNPSQIDKITFSNNQVTFENNAGFNLSKTDFLAYFKYLSIFYSSLLSNFPYLSSYFDNKLPLCEYDIKVGTTRLTYVQQYNSIEIINLTYFLNTQIMTFAARATNMIISMQEFFMTIYNLARYSKEIGLN